MALSPNYSWAEPDNSSLVKNGAQDIRALGDAIDTSVWNVGFGQAGKNKVINGDFSIWQRGTSFTSPSFADYLADRWKMNNYNVAPTTYSFTRETFTPGTAPVAGYEGQSFGRSTITTVGSNTQYDTFFQRIEDVRTFAGQTATLSFYAKSDSSRIQQMLVQQNFGSGGSANVTINAYGTNNFTTTTSWQRFSVTLSFPSIAGKTIGAGNYIQFGFRQVSASGSVLDIWGVQLEYGSKATPFQTATGTIQGEVAACQRYYYRLTNANLAWGANYSTTVCRAAVYFPVEMRTAPTALEQSGTASDYAIGQAGGGGATLSGVPLFSGTSPRFATVNGQVTAGLTIFNPAYINQNTSNGFLGWSAEL